ncbi:hypothetical protein [Microbacterium capsulatum]|uniref:Uncharacterized protein n=1 Tax=Microbacterium capsulatum TaxID=3041921 RepID=A0ABU0XJA4_9MICO|nr:hypothetical protein [Microbacterium sp. ASV81]MDQ4214744.1 hypothetical protein [Microbacterium sp. ASV81]
MSIYEVPDDGEVERTLSAVGEPALRRLFFQELENPEWLAPLTRLKAFSDPGVAETDEGIMVRPWPEGDYLRTIAVARPAEVADVLVDLGGSRNPWVLRTLVDIAAELPIDQLVQLVPGVILIIQGGASRVDEVRIAVITERLIGAGKRKDARKVLTALFSPVPGDDEESVFGSRTRISSAIDDYWYKELAVRLAPRIAELGLEGLKLATGWLMRAVEIRLGEEAGRVFGIRRPSIAPHNQNNGIHDIDDALINLVRDVGVAVTQASGSREAVDFLNERSCFLVRRVAVEVAATAFDFNSDELVAAAAALLCDASLLDHDARPEYGRLAEAVMPHLSDKQLDNWTDLIVGGTWLPDEDRLRRMAAWPDGDPDAVSQAEIDQQRRRLTHRLLSAFSTGLRSRLADTFATLSGEFGPVQHPRFTSYFESFSGTRSPLSTDELSAMSAEDVAEYLAGWSPDPMGHIGPSVDGLASVLEGVVAEAPGRFDVLRDRLASLKPPYVRSIVSGWTKAVSGGFRPSTELWQTLADLAEHEPVGAVHEAEINIDDDPRWRPVHQALVRLAMAVVDAVENIDQLEAAWRVLKPLTNHIDPTPEHEARYGGSNMDPLTLSLNTVRPDAIRGSIHLLTALEQVSDPEAAATQRSEVLSQLAPHVGPSADSSLAVAAVFGEGLGRIWSVDESWVTDRMNPLITSVASTQSTERAWADVVVSVAVRRYPANAVVMRMLRPAIEAVLSHEYSQEDHVDGWRERLSTVQSAASHVVWCVALGVLSLDDPLVTALFSGSADADALAEVIGHHGWQLMHIVANDDSSDPPIEFVERSQALIEWRLAAARQGIGTFDELRQFHWWVKSGAFEISWWLPILAEITREGVTLDKTFIGDALEGAAAEDASTTIEVYERLLGDGEYWQRYDLMQHAAPIVVAALKSSNQDAVTRARSLMDSFAREGHLDVVDQIDRLADPKA